ncbi:MAG: succinate dehydrogenase [Rhodospirillaceae bacterium]|nr:succinate dehydrogenase [Rhodospirillaceae bacterium]
MTDARLYLLQRATAVLLAPLVLVHLGLILHAVEAGLSAAEILQRTRGSIAWATFYGLFVLAVAVHAPIGLRNVAREWLAWGGRWLNWATFLMGVLLLWLGARAVWAVVGGGL